VSCDAWKSVSVDDWNAMESRVQQAEMRLEIAQLERTAAHEAGRQEGIMEAQSNDLHVAIRNHAYAKGVEAAALWMRARSKLVRDFGVSYSTEVMKRNLLPSPPPQAVEPPRGISDECGSCPNTKICLAAERCLAYIASPAPPQAHWEVRGKDVTLVAAETSYCSYCHSNGSCQFHPAPPAVPAGEGPTADQWRRALVLLDQHPSEFAAPEVLAEWRTRRRAFFAFLREVQR
jgi:hypothetical protein